MAKAEASLMLSYRRFVAPCLVAVLFAAPLIPIVPVYWITLLDNIGLAALVVIGLVLLTGVGGMTSFGQATFCGFGAYTTAVLTTAYGVSPWLSLFAALAVTGLAAMALGLISVRLSGHYLPLGTLCWGMALVFLFGRLDFLGRHDGVTSIPPLSIAGHEFIDGREIFYVIWICVILASIGAVNLLDSRIGRAIRALRGARTAAESLGVETARVKLIVFIYAALLAGLSGWLYAHMQRAVNPSPFGFTASTDYLLMAVIGGAGHVWAAVFGAGLIVLLKEALQRFAPDMFDAQTNIEPIVFGIALVIILARARDGLWPYVARLLPEPAAKPLAHADPLPRRAQPESGARVLEISGLCKRFQGLVAVDGVDLVARAGEIVALIGPNGAGKSTTFNLVAGVLKPTAGSILFRGQRIDGLAPPRIAALGLARTFQHVKIEPEMSVLDNVALGAHSRGSAGSLRALLRLDRAEEARLRADAARQIDRVGLGALTHRPAGSLALGQLRLLEIARALCLDPILLLLDEPAAGLRFQEKQRLAELLRQLRGEGMSLLLVEHDMSFVMGLADHIVVLDFGARIAAGRPDEIRVNPAVIEAYLGGVA